MDSLWRRLQATHSPLADSAEAMEQLQRQLDSVLDDVDNLSGPTAKSPRTSSYAVHLSEEIGTTRATQRAHPVESANVAVEMFQVLLPVVTAELRTHGMGDNAAAEIAALALQRSIMQRVGLGALAYANYLLKKVFSSHRDERHRIARELHDGAAHSIGVALQSLKLHQIYLKSDPETAEEKIALAREVLHDALDSVRETAQELHGSRPGCGDLEKALRDYLCSHVPADIDATVSITGNLADVPDEVCEELFIMLREAIRNAVLHSGGRSIDVRVDVDESQVHAIVEDDGHGFEVARRVTVPVGDRPALDA